jgi:hypothetical protein
MLSFITAAKGVLIGIAILGVVAVALIATPGRTALGVQRLIGSGVVSNSEPAISPAALTLRSAEALPVIDGPMH